MSEWQRVLENMFAAVETSRHGRAAPVMSKVSAVGTPCLEVSSTTQEHPTRGVIEVKIDTLVLYTH